MNEFLWESATSTQFLAHLADVYDADLILATPEIGPVWLGTRWAGSICRILSMLAAHASMSR